jgi:hypothetical protein
LDAARGPSSLKGLAAAKRAEQLQGLDDERFSEPPGD